MRKFFRPVCILATLLLAETQLILASDSTFTSPTGRVSVRFSKLSHSKYTKEQLEGSIDNNNNVVYRLTFTNGRSRDSYTTEYTDVYSSYTFAYNQGKPTSLDSIVAQMIWSPSDGFAILPEEAWPSAPGPPVCKVINLDSRWNWSTSVIAMECQVWLDSITVAGTAYNDCNYCVMLFDGRTGKDTSIVEGKSPIGYELVGLRGDSLIIRTLLDNCQRVADAKSFKPEEIAIKLEDIKRKYLKRDG
jgi:hypothetical protein